MSNGGQIPHYMPPCIHCGHPARHHSANECWTNPDGTESEDNNCGRCPIGYDPAPSAADQ